MTDYEMYDHPCNNTNMYCQEGMEYEVEQSDID